MNEPQIQFDRATEEQASLYVLGLLTDSDRAEFEARLAQQAALRDFVRELQRGLEQEVFAEPAPVPPLSVWGRISAETRSDDAPVVPFPSTWQRWSLRALAAAACLALGAGLHWWWQTGPAEGSLAKVSPESVRMDSGRSSPTAEDPKPVPGVARSAARMPDAAPALAAGPGPTGPLAGDTEKLQLERRVRALTTQVASLNQILQQRMALPSGVTRLHVFQLGQNGQTNPPMLAGTTGNGRSLAESLARLAAEQLAANRRAEVSTTEDSTATASAAEPPPDVSVVAVVPATPQSATDPSEDADATSATAGNGMTELASVGSPTVFVDPDTGTGALALPSSKDWQFQIWSQKPDGTVDSLGVVPESESPVSVVTFDANGTSPENLFLSFEPKGGSRVPTGPTFGGPTTTNSLPTQP